MAKEWLTDEEVEEEYALRIGTKLRRRGGVI
jgi:hypothetical protein